MFFINKINNRLLITFIIILNSFKKIFLILPKIKTNNMITIKEYAALCGVSVTAIVMRIKTGELLAEKLKISGRKIRFIDEKRFPPSGKKKPGLKVGWQLGGQ